jgi:arsenate reductase (glutaredoxin)
VELWFNPSCSKSRAAKSQLEDAGVGVTVRNYLDEPPTVAELDTACRRLGKEPWDLARLHEPVADQLGLASLPHRRDEWLRVLAAHPVLIQRPLLFTDDGGGVIARTPEAIEGTLGR